jgi:hypothetical protein
MKMLYKYRCKLQFLNFYFLFLYYFSFEDVHFTYFFAVCTVRDYKRLHVKSHVKIKPAITIACH